MPEFLYLDTARLGRMSPGAQLAHRDFAALAGAEGASERFERFLRSGLEALPGRARQLYPGLAAWEGIGGLHRSLRALAGGRPDLPVLLANRSAQLMKFAARLLFHPCRNVLVTDLGWPPYHAILERECSRACRSITTVPVREAVLRHGGDGEGLAERVCSAFARSRCDGLFLTAVSHLGVRLPVERIVRALEAAHDLWFVVVDGAQDFCHASADLRNEYCDLYLAGCHKWLGAYHPMGLGFYGRRRSRGLVETVLADMAARGDLDDPLLRFSTQLEGGPLDWATETVNLAPLFSCQGAAGDAARAGRQPLLSLGARLENAAVAASIAAEEGWLQLLPSEGLRSGILLLQAARAPTRLASPEALRAAFCEAGVALTAYEGGVVRLSMPGRPLGPEEADCLRRTLRRVA